MTYGVQLPDGRVIGFDESVPPEQAQLIVRRDFPEAFKKKEGAGAQFSAGLEDLISSTKTGIAAPFLSKQSISQELLKQQAREAEGPKTGTWEDVKKAYQDYGVLGGLGEFGTQTAEGLMRQAPQIATTLGAGLVGGLPGAAAATFLPIAGQNIMRQAEEQQKLGQEIDPSLLKAYGAAAPATALDLISLRTGLGSKLAGKMLGRSERELAEAVAKNRLKVEAELVEAAQASLLPTIAKGTARGLTEIPTEMAQQVLERAQAGLDLFSEEALNEYGAAGYQALQVGPAFGALASPIDRAVARGQLDQVRASQRQEQQKQLLADQQQYRESPEYVDDLLGRKSKLEEDMSLLQPILKGKATTEEDKQIKREAGVRMRDLKLEMQDVISQLRDVAPETKGLPETLDQRIWRERIAKQTAPIAKERDLVTDEFGNIVPGLTKEAALTNRTLSAKDRSAADRAMLDLKKLLEAEKQRQLTMAEKARKDELMRNMEATTESERLWRDLGLVNNIINSESLYKPDIDARSYLSPATYDKNGVGTPATELKPSLVRRKGLELVLSPAGKPIDEEQRRSYENAIDSGVLNRSVIGFFGLGSKKELGQKEIDLNVLEDATRYLGILEERAKSLAVEKGRLASKELINPDGSPTPAFNQAIANEVVYGELSRLINRAKATIKDSKGEQIVDAALERARNAEPAPLNLIDRNLAPAAYEKLVGEELNKQQASFDDIRITLDDLAEGDYVGGRKQTPKVDENGNLVGTSAEELKQTYESLDKAYKDIYPTFEDFYAAKANAAGATKQVLEARLEKAKEEYINSAIRQAEAYRASKGLPHLTEGEYKHAVAQMREVLDEATTRGQLTEDEFANVQQQSLKPIYEEITMPAQMRAGKIATPAYTYRKLVGYEGLSDEAKERQTDQLFQDVFGKGAASERGFTNRAAALGSIGFDYGPRLPAKMVKQMRGSGIAAKAAGAPSEKIAPGQKITGAALTEHRGYVQDKLSQIKVGLMQRPKQPGEGTVRRVPKEKEVLFLTKTEQERKEAPVQRTQRVLDNAKQIARKLSGQKGVAKDIGNTLTRAIDFVDAQLQLGKEADTAQIDKVVDLVSEELDLIERGRAAAGKRTLEVSEELGKTLDNYQQANNFADFQAGQRELFPESKRAAQRQLARYTEERKGKSSKELADLKDLLDVDNRIKETETWLSQFAGRSGMGRSQAASAIRSLEVDLSNNLRLLANGETEPFLDKIERDRKAFEEAAAKAKATEDSLNERRGLLNELEYWIDYTTDLKTYFKYAYLPSAPVHPAKHPRFNTALTFSDGMDQAIAAYEALDKMYKERPDTPFEGDQTPLSQEERKQEFYKLLGAAKKRIKEINALLQPEKAPATKLDIEKQVLQDSTAELEETVKAAIAHHAAVLESIKNAPERIEHWLNMERIAEIKMQQYQALIDESAISGAFPGEVEHAIKNAKAEAEKFANYAKNTAASIEKDVSKDKVLARVFADKDIKKLMAHIKRVAGRIEGAKKWVQTALSEEGKEARDLRLLEGQQLAERVKASNESTKKIAAIKKSYTRTAVPQKSLNLIVKQRAAAAAIDANTFKIDELQHKIDTLELQKEAAAAGKITPAIKKKLDAINKGVEDYKAAAEKFGFVVKPEDVALFEIKLTEATKKPASLNAQQQKALAKAYKDLALEQSNLNVAKAASSKLAAAGKAKAVTVESVTSKQEENAKQSAYDEALILLNDKKNELQQKIYGMNKAKKPKAEVDVVEEQKSNVKFMIDRLHRLGLAGLRNLTLDDIKRAKDFAETLRINKEIAADIAAAEGVRLSLQELEDSAKLNEERANVAVAQGRLEDANDLRAMAKEQRDLINAEKTMLRHGDAPEKIIHKHALRTGHNNFYKTAEAAARAEAKKSGFTSIAAADKFIKTRTNEIYNRMLSNFLKDPNGNESDGTVFNTAKTISGPKVDLEEAGDFINKLLKKEGIDLTRRAINTVIAATTLPINKLPSIKSFDKYIKNILVSEYLIKGDLDFDEHHDRYSDAVAAAIKATGMTEKQVMDAVGDYRFEILQKINAIEQFEKAAMAHPKFDMAAYNDVLDDYTKLATGMDANELINAQIYMWEGPQSAYDFDITMHALNSTGWTGAKADALNAGLKGIGAGSTTTQQDLASPTHAKTVRLANGIDFTYLPTIADAPAELLVAITKFNKHPESIKGAVLPDGRVIVVGANHSSIAELEETIAHENIGHYAVDKLLGPKGFKALVKKVFANGEDEALKLAVDLGVYDDMMEAKAAAESAGLGNYQKQLLMTREMIAHVAPMREKLTMTARVKEFIKSLVNAVRKWFTSTGLDENAKMSTQDIYNLIDRAKKNLEQTRPGVYESPSGDVVFFAPTTYGAPVDQRSIDIFDKLYAKKAGLKDTILANATGIGAQVQWFDNLAAWEHLIKSAEQRGMMDSLKALEANYYMRAYNRRVGITAEAGSYGVPNLKVNEHGEMDIVSRGEDAASLSKVAKILEKAKALGSPKVVTQFFQTYLVAQRVKNKGIRVLSADLRIKQEDLKHIENLVASLPEVDAAFKEAASVYAQYNKDLLDFMVKTGAMTKELAAELTRNNDFVPFYRVNKAGQAELVISGEHAFIVGRMKEDPYLHELVGGKEMLVDFEESAFQNTAMLIDMALRNLATTTLATSMEQIGVDPKHRIAKRVSPRLAGEDIIRSKVNGVEAAWRIDTKDTGFDEIPPELLIKGLEGIKVTIPGIFKVMGIPTRWLRNMITRTPTYMTNQIVKDSTAMWLYSGANMTPVISATKELGSMLQNKNQYERELQAAGVLSGQVFSGMPEDAKKAMLQIMGGDKGWDALMRKADRMALKADGATRVAMYRSFLDQGMSPMRAKLATTEALDVHRRGLSPTMYIMSTLTPFMNTQVQALNVLAKAFTGKLDIGQQKNLRAKMMRRGLMLAGMTMAYAAVMSDDEAYKNADPFTRYNNWFIKLPFFKEPIKVPAPFEFGYAFKALPEAVYGMMFKGKDGKDFKDFLVQASINSVPFGIPQAAKPSIEAFTDYSFYSGRSIQSKQEQGMLPGYRERPQTTEISKIFGKAAPEYVSPVMVDYLARGYGGGLTLALMSVLNPFLAPTSQVAAPEKMPSQYPLIGGFFQPNDAMGLVNSAYETATRIQQASKTFDSIAATGDAAKATAFAKKYASEIAMETEAGALVREMGELNKAEKAVRSAPDKVMSPADKTERLKEIRAAKIKLAENFENMHRALEARK